LKMEIGIVLVKSIENGQMLLAKLMNSTNLIQSAEHRTA
jgi:hypothetical protein